MSIAGHQIKAGETVEYLDVGLRRTEVKSSFEGYLRSILVGDNELVGLDQPLIELRPHERHA